LAMTVVSRDINFWHCPLYG